MKNHVVKAHISLKWNKLNILNTDYYLLLKTRVKDAYMYDLTNQIRVIVASVALEDFNTKVN